MSHVLLALALLLYSGAACFYAFRTAKGIVRYAGDPWVAGYVFVFALWMTAAHLLHVVAIRTLFHL